MRAQPALQNQMWERSAPCRERTGEVYQQNGECPRCFAANGEACREPLIVDQRPEQDSKTNS